MFQTNIRRLMEEAHRRFEAFADGSPPDKAWIGLGTPSTYRPATDAGIMRPLDRERPRVLNWYLFTPEGVELYRQYVEWLECGPLGRRAIEIARKGIRP